MPERTWVSHYIVPCPGNSSCKHCKPGEPHPQQHTFSKLVRESNSPEMPTSPSPKPLSVERQRYLRRHKLMGVSYGNLDPVPFDPKLDPQPYACFICWSLLHLTRHCQETASHVYCCNCGRRDVSVEECPRCARAYREHREKRRRSDEEKREFARAVRKARRGLKEEDLYDLDSTSDGRALGFAGVDREMKSVLKVRGKLKYEDEESDGVIRSIDSRDKGKVAGLKQEEGEKEYWSGDGKKYQEDSFEGNFTKEYEDAQVEDWRESRENGFENSTGKFKSAKQDSVNFSSTPLTSQFGDNYSDSCNDNQNVDSNELFIFMRNQKMQDQEESDRINREAALTSFGGISESEYYFYDEEEEDYDDYVVDEDERSESLCSQNYAIRFFLDLLDALKDLSIETQTIAVLNFVSARKKQKAC